MRSCKPSPTLSGCPLLQHRLVPQQLQSIWDASTPALSHPLRGFGMCGAGEEQHGADQRVVVAPCRNVRPWGFREWILRRS